jgi:tetratricopeptide (TPR) repeat protein
VLKALDLDETLAEAHITLANIKAFYDHDWPAGEREFRRGVELNPNSADGHLMFADFLISTRRCEEWAAEMQRVLELDPANPFFQCFYGWHLVYLSRCDEAIAQLRKALRVAPNFPAAHMALWGAFYRKGMHEEAMAEAQEFFAVLGDHEVKAALARSYAGGSYSKAMRAGAETLVARSARSHVPSVRIARLYAHAGESDQVLQWLRKACEEREGPLGHLSVGWDWDVVRSDPRFQELLQRVGLPDETGPPSFLCSSGVIAEDSG